MGLLAPLALGFAALAAPIVLFYMLKLRRQEMLVSSTLLWMQALRDMQANAPWQRLQRNLLLLLQLLILALLVLAVARPFFETPSLIGGNVIVLLDGSASMQAVDVKPSRFEAAKSIVGRMVDDLASEDQMTIVFVAGQAEVIVSASGDKSAIKSALAPLRPKNSAADFADAIALGVASAERVPGSTLVIVGDGGIGDIPIDKVPVPVRFIPVGQSSNNVAISSVAVRESAQGTQLYLGLANYGEATSKARANIYLDGQLFDSREAELAPKEEGGFAWSALPQTVSLVHARLDVADDLTVDNAAWASRSRGGTVKVLLVSAGNLFLEHALSLLPNVDLSRMQADSAALPEGFDLYVLDSVVPPLLPRGSILFVNPVESPSLFNVGGEVTNLGVTKVRSDDSVLSYVYLNDLRVAKAKLISPPDWAKVIVESDAIPLLVMGETEGRRVAILPFDLHASNLPLLVAFPILTANLVGWLGPSGSSGVSAEVKAGDPITFSPDPRSREIEVKRPDGSSWRTGVGQGSVTYAETDLLGVYEIAERLDGGGSTVSRFVVNLADPRESDITPSKTVPLQGEGASGAADQLLAKRELWWPLLAAALTVLMVEWWVDQRRRGRRRSISPADLLKNYRRT